MLWRKKEKQIMEWLSRGKKALLVTGARQIGKTFLIRETLRKEKVNFVEFNLIENPSVIKALESAKGNSATEALRNLTLLTDQPLIKGETIIFLDEIQEYKEIMTMIKFLVEEGSFKYILSGSLLGVELSDLKSAPVGFVEVMQMYPLDLEEFLVAIGVRQDIIQLLKEHFKNLTPVNDFIHQKLLDAVYQYLIVGGMPEAVQTYVSEHDYNQVLAVQNAIIPLYKHDFTKYEAQNNKLKLIKTYELIPSELNEKNKRYTFSKLDKELKYNRYEESFEWLIHAGVAVPVYNVTEPRAPLALNEKANLFKFFMSDVGLLMSCFGKTTILKTLNKEKGLNFGAMFENLVAQELNSHGYKGYYFNSRKQGEVDFVIEYENECTPIEVKSGKDYTIHSALNNILSNTEYNINKAYVLCNGNVEKKGKIIYLPIYMIMFFDEHNQPLPMFKPFDLSNL